MCICCSVQFLLKKMCFSLAVCPGSSIFLVAKFFFLLSYFYFPRDDFCASVVPFLITSCSYLMYVLSYNSEDIISFFLASVSSDYKYCFCLFRASFLFSVLFYCFFSPLFFLVCRASNQLLILTHNTNLAKNQQALK